ncbi:MAG: adenylate/guanylate cyclase domain-containing protein [Rhizobiaceae bacterium]|nr:adenylate/guanylate cyclase domain-containing protein [Rhizobiaceae bacterium]
MPTPQESPWKLLSNEQILQAVDIRDYMLGAGRLNADPDVTLTELARRITAAGVALERCVTIVRILHAINTASYRMWEKDKGATSFAIPFASESDGMYENSPSALAHKSNEWVGFDPRELEESTFGIVRELCQESFTHYICAPTMMVNGLQNVFTFATKAEGGFSDANVAFLRAIFPAMEACQEILVTHRILKEVTRTYVGEDPHQRILAGDVHRGEVTSRRAAILFTDMRDFTELTSTMTAQQATDLLNEYYDCLVPTIEGNGGEVLKFIADGVLAMFRVTEDEERSCQSALAAAQAGMKAVKNRNQSSPRPFEIGTALHFGEVAYGNVGSGERLDYTVIGSDVNLASRVADLCKQLDDPLLLSQQLATRLPSLQFSSHGEHSLKGLSEPVAIFSCQSDEARR